MYDLADSDTRSTDGYIFISFKTNDNMDIQVNHIESTNKE